MSERHLQVITNPVTVEDYPFWPLTDIEETRGILCYSANNVSEIDPDKRITLAGLAQRLGEKIQPIVVKDFSPQPSKVHRDVIGFAQMRGQALEQGLYIYFDDPRYRDAQQLNKSRFRSAINEAERTGLKLPIPSNYRDQPGVVFDETQYRQAVQNIEQVTKAKKADTRRANLGNSDVAEKNRRANSTSAKVAASYVFSLRKLLVGYTDDAARLRVLRRQTHVKDGSRRFQNQFQAGKLDFLRQWFDRVYFKTIETSAINNNCDQDVILEAHKKDIQQRYQGDSALEIVQSWQQAIDFQGLYTNARYLKVLQSLRGCEAHHSVYRPYMREVALELVQAGKVSQSVARRVVPEARL
jgi:hypothetical protein